MLHSKQQLPPHSKTSNILPHSTCRAPHGWVPSSCKLPAGYTKCGSLPFLWCRACGATGLPLGLASLLLLLPVPLPGLLPFEGLDGGSSGRRSVTWMPYAFMLLYLAMLLVMRPMERTAR